MAHHQQPNVHFRLTSSIDQALCWEHVLWCYPQTAKHHHPICNQSSHEEMVERSWRSSHGNWGSQWWGKGWRKGGTGGKIADWCCEMMVSYYFLLLISQILFSIELKFRTKCNCANTMKALEYTIQLVSWSIWEHDSEYPMMVHKKEGHCLYSFLLPTLQICYKTQGVKIDMHLYRSIKTFQYKTTLFPTKKQGIFAPKQKQSEIIPLWHQTLQHPTWSPTI